ncbi:beta-galactosidase 15-like isoform X1 [Andrographis paniculata]|uniref:beta-galactosidase 15-like isoform X1 n=1 Tax=Andrographis paniculata TaxID=175694 RepID=UPI0021E917E7|nr:beta-galactosidase 15-like isoform X1 [Andrographis paniculata]
MGPDKKIRSSNILRPRKPIAGKMRHGITAVEREEEKDEHRPSSSISFIVSWQLQLVLFASGSSPSLEGSFFYFFVFLSFFSFSSLIYYLFFFVFAIFLSVLCFAIVCKKLRKKMHQQRLKQQQQQQALMQQSLYHPGLLAPQIEPILSGNLPPGFDSSTCRSVYVGNIHPQVTEPLLQEIFSSTGPLEGCKLLRKDKSSYGFVDYFDRQSAALAIVTLNGRHLFGQPIKVNWAYASAQREDTTNHFNVFVGDLSPEVTDATLYACFSVYPSVSDARVMWDQKTGRSRGFGFVSFRNQQDAQSAINDLNGKWLGSRQIRCNWATKGAGLGDEQQASDSKNVVELTNGTSGLLLLVFLLFLSSSSESASATDVSHDGRAIKINGERRILLSGSIHYPRSTSEMWPDLIKKAKAGGLDAIETYVFWNAHEPQRRRYNFDGNLDLVRFIKTVADEGLYAVLRIGPYVCAEWNYGGFPVWLHNLRGIQLRTQNDVYKNEMKNFTMLIVDMMKKEKLFASQGGPIILAQIENEYGNVMSAYGDAGKEYVKWCANLAESLHIGVPWIMCQQDDAPQPIINTCNGFYCDQFTPNNRNSPKMWTENWTGWFKNWGGKDPLRTAEDVAYAVARFYQLGGTFQNYYMYHGGTNFGRTSGGPYITTSYDYDAPLNEYGGFNQPKYGHLKQLHDVLHSLEKALTYGNVSHTDLGNNSSRTIYAYNGTETCFFGNANPKNDTTFTYKGINLKVPAWSVSILPDCKNEAYNTAKVNTQTSVMVKASNEAENEPDDLKWSWRPENVDRYVKQGKGQVSANKLLDQKSINDLSDYLWYMTSVKLDKDDPVLCPKMSLRVNETGHVIHAFVNGEHIGSEWASYGVFHYNFERPVKLNPGKNKITLLSATVGLQNYGPKFDIIKSGLPGPVSIVGKRGDETIIKDLSAHKWSYHVGMKGLNEFAVDDKAFAHDWRSDDLPVNKMLTWYKTTFKAPLEEDPVVVDLEGLGKGMAWVNGNSLGRYWPRYLADGNCSGSPCDYRGTYDPDKCASNCGEATQRWYHVPRTFMDRDVNELVVFEEFGGNPSLVNFRTIRPGTVCGSAYENKDLELTCHGRPISAIKFASFGDPQGRCGSFNVGRCEAVRSVVMDAVVRECVGKDRCVVSASEKVLGSTGCSHGVSKRLLVEAAC